MKQGTVQIVYILYISPQFLYSIHFSTIPVATEVSEGLCNALLLTVKNMHA